MSLDSGWNGPRRGNVLTAGCAHRLGGPQGSDALSASEERSLARRAQQGDREARERIIESALPVVSAIVRQFASGRVERDDLTQEGTLGLCEALERFDAARGFRFSTYAAFWVRKRILHALTSSGRMIRVPASTRRLQRQAKQLREEITARTGAQPSTAELAEAMEIPASRLAAALASPEEPVSLEMLCTPGADSPVLDVVDKDAPSPETRLLNDSRRDTLHTLLGTLPERDRAVIEGRFGLKGNSVSVADLAAELSITCDSVRQIQHRALLKLRKQDGAKMLLS